MSSRAYPPGLSARVPRRRRAMILAAVAVLTSVSACASIARGSFKAPVVTLKEFAITGLGLTGGSVDVVLSVYNPNGYKLEALGMTYHVDVDSVKLGEGQLDDRFVVQKNDSSVVRLPVRFNYAGLGAAGRALIAAGTINYRVHGDFTVSTPIGNFTRPYDRLGRYSSVKGTGR
jgi:LEA14-like dessication related protein